MSERANDPTFTGYNWTDTMWRKTFGQQTPGGTGTQGAQPTYQQYPTPRYDSPGWTPWQREVNGRLQAIGAGNVFDGIAPHFSERYKPGFDPNVMSPSANSPLSLPGMSAVLTNTPILKQTPIPILGPFAGMASAEDILEKAVGKQIWDRSDPDQTERWWMENTD